MRKFLSTDIAARIIALVISVFVWIYVVVLLDPLIDIRISDIPVIYTNTVNLTNDGYVLMNEKPSAISIRIRGSRTMLAKFDKQDITAYIDLNGYNQAGTFSLPVSVRLPYEELSVVEKKPYSLSVKIDRIITRTLPVSVRTTGTPKEDYAMHESVLSLNTVELKGAEEIISSIDRAEVTVDISGMSSDVIASVPVTFYNTNEDIVTSKYLTSTPEKLDVRCVILKKKTVPVKIIISGGEQTHTAQPLTNGKITVLAKPEVADSIAEVYSKPINVSNINADTKLTAQLDLPNGVFTEGNITEVTAEIKVKNNAN